MGKQLHQVGAVRLDDGRVLSEFVHEMDLVAGVEAARYVWFENRDGLVVQLMQTWAGPIGRPGEWTADTPTVIRTEAPGKEAGP